MAAEQRVCPVLRRARPAARGRACGGSRAVPLWCPACCWLSSCSAFGRCHGIPPGCCAALGAKDEEPCDSSRAAHAPRQCGLSERALFYRALVTSLISFQLLAQLPRPVAPASSTHSACTRARPCRPLPEAPTETRPGCLGPRGCLGQGLGSREGSNSAFTLSRVEAVSRYRMGGEANPLRAAWEPWLMS